MTAQIPDTLLFNDKSFSIVGVNGNELFNPQSIGLHPIPFSTACWRGYVCEYKLHNNTLVLDRLQISLEVDAGAQEERKLASQRGPVINGVSPSTPDGEIPTARKLYEGLNLSIKFTGSILAGDGFIQELYVHMGFHPAWKYQTVFELQFEGGKVLEIHDLSSKMERIRLKMSRLPPEPDFLKASQQERDAWIEKTFRLNYDLDDD